MELLLIILAIFAVGGYFIWKERKHEEAESHPLDGATKAPEPWPFPTSRPPEGNTKPAEEPLPVMPTLTAALDVNHDGKVDIKDAVEVVAKAKKKVAQTADLNNDGKVDINDAKVVVEATKKVTRKAKQKVVESVEKVKKPRKSKQ